MVITIDHHLSTLPQNCLQSYKKNKTYTNAYCFLLFLSHKRKHRIVRVIDSAILFSNL